MGCDIHLKLEKKIRKPSFMYKYHYGEDGKVTNKEVVEVPSYGAWSLEWHPVEITRKNCWSDRVYGMFARLADARNYWKDEVKVIPQRGFPEDACDKTKDAYSYFVVSDEAYERNNGYEHSSLNFINESKANEWVAEGLSEEMKFGNEAVRKISGPDWHSANWCTTEEMKQCIHDTFWDEEKQVWVGDFIEWFALLGAMEGIEKGGFYECRAVFWFDN